MNRLEQSYKELVDFVYHKEGNCSRETYHYALLGVDRLRSKKPNDIEIRRKYYRKIGGYVGRCPVCDTACESTVDNYCSNCGQRLEWQED